MAWTIEYNAAAQKDVKKLDTVTRRRIRSFLEERVLSLPDPRRVGTALEGPRFKHLWRYRVGEYRILCDIQDQKLVVLVVEIGHRREVYR